MTHVSNARVRRLRQPLSEVAIASVLKSVLPRRCNFSGVKYSELLDEALHFGVTTRGSFQRIMKQHRRRVISIDQAPLDELNRRIYRQELGDIEFASRMRLQRWFNWEGLTRLALELEFGEAYEQYVRERYASEARHVA